MKPLSYISVLALVGIMAACHEAKKPVPAYEAKRDSMLARRRNPHTERMPDYNYTAHLEDFVADSYAITRRAVDSLGVVIDDDGTRYVNNVVTLTLKGGDRTILSRSFTKSDFAPLGDSRFMSRSVLQGMAFDCVGEGRARFMASVGLPSSDEYVQFAITVQPGGEYTIEAVEIMDETLIDSI